VFEAGTLELLLPRRIHARRQVGKSREFARNDLDPLFE